MTTPRRRWKYSTLCFPPIVPWWLTVAAVLVAIVAVKHLYGGLGQNPFNPAMVAYCVMIVAFPALMSQWPPAGQLSFDTQLGLILGGARDIDGITGATALDTMRTGLRGGAASVDTVLQSPTFGFLGGRGWEWISVGYIAGGLFLLATRTITWRHESGRVRTAHIHVRYDTGIREGARHNFFPRKWGIAEVTTSESEPPDPNDSS